MNVLAISPRIESEISSLMLSIAASRNPRRTQRAEHTIHFEASALGALREGVAGKPCAHIVRCAFNVLNFDEHRLFKLRLEHKLVQTSVLTRCVPGMMVTAYGLGDLLQRFGSQRIRESLADVFPKGCFIKRTVGDQSGDEGNPNLLESILVQIDEGILKPPSQFSMTEESYLVQEQIPIAHEYRVHTVEDSVVSDLTFYRYQTGVVGPHSELVNAYVQSILDQLPAGIVGQSMLGWDIAEMEAGQFIVIEVNLAGYHPVFNPGFHCSAFFQEPPAAGETLARLLRYIEKTYNVVVHCPEPTVTESDEEEEVYCEVRRFLALL